MNHDKIIEMKTTKFAFMFRYSYLFYFIEEVKGN